MTPNNMHLAEGAGLWPRLERASDAELFIDFASWNPVSIHHHS